MDKELDYSTIEDLLHFIQSFIESSKNPLDFGLYFNVTQHKWKAFVTTFPSIEDQDLRSCLYWLAMHLKEYNKEDINYR